MCNNHMSLLPTTGRLTTVRRSGSKNTRRGEDGLSLRCRRKQDSQIYFSTRSGLHVLQISFLVVVDLHLLRVQHKYSVPATRVLWIQVVRKRNMRIICSYLYMQQKDRPSFHSRMHSIVVQVRSSTEMPMCTNKCKATVLGNTSKSGDSTAYAQ